MAFKLKNQSTFGSSKNFNSTPIVHKDLEEGVLGEANMDGSIYISNKVEPNSEQERSVIMHEMKHMTDMKLGKLAYSDDEIFWNGDKFERMDGHIKFEGQWFPEGDKALPWEQH